MRGTIRSKAALGSALIGLALLALTTGPLFAQTATPEADATPTSDHMGMMDAATPGAEAATSEELHQMMHQMMDTVHGVGTSERMHEAMGPRGEELMAQCAAMMGMMGMMGDGGMSGMMGGQGMDMEGMQDHHPATPAS